MTRIDRRALFTSGAAAALLAAAGGSVSASPKAGGVLRLAVPREGGMLEQAARGAIYDRDPDGNWARRESKAEFGRHGWHAVYQTDDALWTVGGDLQQLRWGAIATDRDVTPTWVPNE